MQSPTPLDSVCQPILIVHDEGGVDFVKRVRGASATPSARGHLVPLAPDPGWENVRAQMREILHAVVVDFASVDALDALFRSLIDFRALRVDRDLLSSAHLGWLPVSVDAEFRLMEPRIARSGVLIWPTDT